MMLKVRLDETDRLEILAGGRVFLGDPRIFLYTKAGPLGEDGELRGGEWVREHGGEMETLELWRRPYTIGGNPLGELRVRVHPTAALVEFELLRDLEFLSEDSFLAPVIYAPAFRLPEDIRFLTLTFGLGGLEESYPGGYWPEFRWGRGPRELPREAFAPLVLWNDGAAVAVAPGNYPLTSPMVRTEGGFARGLHGAVRSLPRGTVLATWIVASPDPFSALRRLSEFLSRHVTRHFVTQHPLLDRLGWWNAYGSYYTELINPLDEAALWELVKAFRDRAFPLGYFGLDLWYRFHTIGKAIRYQSDPRKYPRGLRKLREETNVPYVLHLSALSEENEYGVEPGTPEVYEEIAEELSQEGAIAAWHDWLRTQQFLVPALRGDPEKAERWFSGMLGAFAARGLPVVLCMQTAGMILAAAMYGNAVAARSYTDYLFMLRPALEEAARRGHPEMLEAGVEPVDYRLQNLGVGAVYWSLGIRPFFDLFLTRENPGIGAVDPEGEAILRLLSLGPVGIGDRADVIDWNLLERLLDGQGNLLRPTAPPVPVLESLDKEVKLFWSEVSLDGIPWGYLVALNTSEEEASFRPEHPADMDAVAWDVREGKEIPGRVTVPPRGMAVLLLVPAVHGVFFVGDGKKLLPVHGALELHGDGGLWVVARDGGEFLLFGEREPHFEVRKGRIVEKRREGVLLSVKLSRGSTVRLWR